MAQVRGRSQFSVSYIAGKQEIFGSFSVGAAGAPTLTSGGISGITSIVRNSDGNYTINLSTPFFTLLQVSKTNISVSAPAAPGMYVSANNVSSATAPSITVVMNASGTATDPASGEIINLRIELNRSSLNF